MAFRELKETFLRRAVERRDGVTRAWRTFDIYMTDHRDTSVVARLAPGVPREGDPHDVDPGLHCTAVSVVQDEKAWYIHRCECEYASNVQTTGENPLEAPAQIRWEGGVSREDANFAFDDNGNPIIPIVNSAGTPFERQPQYFRPAARYVVTRNQSEYNHLLYLPYLGKTNKFTFKGASPGTAIIMDISANRLTTDGGAFYYWQATFVIEFTANPFGWDVTLLDNGTYEIGPNGKLREILSENLQPVTSPVRLNGSGVKLPDNTPFNQSVYRNFVVQRRVDFAPLNLP